MVYACLYLTDILSSFFFFFTMEMQSIALTISVNLFAHVHEDHLDVQLISWLVPKNMLCCRWSTHFRLLYSVCEPSCHQNF